jgi:hypothetical protein
MDIWDKFNVLNMIDQLTATSLIYFISQPQPILVYILISWVVTRIPFIKGYFSLCNTLLHGVIRGVLEGGLLNKINLVKNDTNRMSTIENSRFKHTIITYATYTGESLATIGLFYLVSKHNYSFILYLFIGLMVVAVFLWIHHLSGILWALSFAFLLTFPIYFNQPILVMHIGIFLSALLLVQSIKNGIQVCRRSLLERHNPGLSGFLARMKWLPALMLGVVLVGQSLFTGYFIARNILSFL